MCRAHETWALASSGAPVRQWGARYLLVWDNGLLEAEAELAATPAAERSAAHAAELTRVSWLRRYVTGPWPRLGYVCAAGLCSVLLVSAVAGRLGLKKQAGVAATANGQQQQQPRPPSADAEGEDSADGVDVFVVAGTACPVINAVHRDK